ncbi:AraC family transcriptional regulator [Flavobacterium sp.]|uniref:helix-turn-helix domain-containing protein n=1 Tax=Flavobacterium sp. TaxID=239 RepID=UPI0025BFE25A|nr:helix-turn-helix domain-containing protein [Flavobacterium sp.]
MMQTVDIPKKPSSRKDEITADFLKIYENHLAELFAGKADFRMTTSRYAEKLFINKRHLTNTLKETTGKSPCEFMETAIAAEASRLLVETDMSVGEISTRFAWDEPTNFVKFFKGMIGQTPLQFRKKHLG